MVDLPVVVLHACAGRRGFDSHIALHKHRALGGAPVGVALAVGVEGAVVDAEVAGVVGHRHIGADVAAYAYCPVEVLAPVGGVASADVAHCAAVVVLAEKGLAEASALLEFVGQAAVAYHQAELLDVGHLGHMAVAEVGRAPTGGAAVGGIVDQAGAEVVVLAHHGRVARCAAADGNIGHAGGHDGDVVLEVVDVGEAVGTVDVVDDGIIHSGIGVSVAEIACRASVDTGHHNGAVEERRVGKCVLLIHESLLHLRCQLCNRLGREAAVVAVGEVVAYGPGHVVEVGNMVG